MQRRVLPAAFLALAVAGFGCESATKDVTIFQATLAGSNEVPANGSAASGGCSVQIEGNTAIYSVAVNGISNVTGSHIHIAAAGTNGPIRVVLLPTPGGANFLSTPLSSVNGLLMSGDFGGGQVVAITFDQLVSNLRAGTAYCNVHTTAFPGGEIRGQFQPVSLD
jgi:hypothetical protein